MLNRIVQSSLRFRGVVIALACVLIGYGIFVAAHAKLDVFPEFLQPQVTVVGGVLAIFLAGYFGGEGRGSLSLGTLVGFVTLFGITMRNSIMMISHFEHLVREEGLTWGLDTAMRGAAERLVPILMTATAAGLALIPLALRGGQSGSEIQTPMAIVILCGLVTSTFLNMAVVPTLYLRYGRPSQVA